MPRPAGQMQWRRESELANPLHSSVAGFELPVKLNLPIAPVLRQLLILAVTAITERSRHETPLLVQDPNDVFSREMNVW